MPPRVVSSVVSRLVLAALALHLSALMARTAELELLMFEQPGCIYCAAWNADVGPEFPLTDEGKAAPLRRVQLRNPTPEGVTLRTRPVFTPTFVLLADGVETGRIEGYPGEDFFWPLLAKMITDAQTDPEK